MNRQKWMIVVIIVLIPVLAFVLHRALRPSRPVTVSLETAGVSSSDGQTSFPNLKELEETMDRLRSSVAEIETTRTAQSAGGTGETRDPFLALRTSPGRAGSSSAGITLPVSPESILRPSFVVSGILYSASNPLAIIDDEVRQENDSFAGYRIERILPDRVLLNSSGKTFILRVGDGPSPEEAGIVTFAGSPAAAPCPLAEAQVVPPASSAAGRPESVTAKRPRQETVLETGTSAVAAQPQGEPERIRTIQVSSHPGDALEDALRVAKRLQQKGIEGVRVEHIGGMYTVRVGRYDSFEKARAECHRVSGISGAALLRTAYYIEDRIVYGRATRGPEQETSTESRAAFGSRITRLARALGRIAARRLATIGLG